jgi:hypothetical protein
VDSQYQSALARHLSRRKEGQTCDLDLRLLWPAESKNALQLTSALHPLPQISGIENEYQVALPSYSPIVPDLGDTDNVRRSISNYSASGGHSSWIQNHPWGSMGDYRQGLAELSLLVKSGSRYPASIISFATLRFIFRGTRQLATHGRSPGTSRSGICCSHKEPTGSWSARSRSPIGPAALGRR